jgi:2-dehydropantoate 2-reductase
MDVVVFGAGSLGSLVGGLLAREHDVTLVGRESHVAAVREDGLRVSGAVEARVHPAATAEGTGLAADLAVVTVKAFDTGQAARALATGDVDAALSLQNGLGNEETLAAHLDGEVLAGTATYGAVLEEPGHVRCTGVGEVVLGARDGGRSTHGDEAGAAFQAAGLETTVAADMPRRLWEKLAVNAGINGPTALARVPNGAVLDGDLWSTAGDAAREAAEVARAEGVDLSDEEAVDAVERVAEATAANTSSTLQDVRAGRRTEVDALVGAVVRRGDEHGVATPVNRTLASLLRGWERDRGLRGE